ncbi:MAG TPA: hypothetical protein VFT78_06040 [Hanamia sp.]|nr:hypothetical protein [Hanamia sp.]
MNFIRNNLLSLSALTIYFVWWLYLDNFAEKIYDNHYAGAVAVGFLGMVTILIIIACIVGFSIAAFKTRQYKKYMVFIGIILLPVVITFMAVFLYHPS